MNLGPFLLAIFRIFSYFMLFISSSSSSQVAFSTFILCARQFSKSFLCFYLIILIKTVLSRYPKYPRFHEETAASTGKSCLISISYMFLPGKGRAAVAFPGVRYLWCRLSSSKSVQLLQAVAPWACYLAFKGPKTMLAHSSVHWCLLCCCCCSSAFSCDAIPFSVPYRKSWWGGDVCN